MNPVQIVLLATSKSHAEYLARLIALHGDEPTGQAAREEAEQMLTVLADQLGERIAQQERQRLATLIALESEWLDKDFPTARSAA